jgi:hypothetical protein
VTFAFLKGLNILACVNAGEKEASLSFDLSIKDINE